MAFNVGDLVAYLRLDSDQFDRGLDEAKAKADKLDAKNVDVKVRADTAAANAKLAETAAIEDKVNENNKKIAQSSQQAAQPMSALATAIITLGPALVPIAAGAAGLAAGWSAMGAAGLLAFLGIKQEMANGTQVGRTYSDQLAVLKGDLSQLETTAATGVLGPFEQTVHNLQHDMPNLNTNIAEFSNVTGKAASAVVSGLVAAFITLEPLERQAAAYTLNLSQRFEAMMSGPGVKAFGDYVMSVFPQVMGDVEALVGAAVHLVQALAPLGMGTLGIIRDLSTLISAIPTNVLTMLAQGATAVYIAFSVYKGLSGPISALGDSLQSVLKTTQGTSGELSGLGGVLSRLGITADVAKTAVAGLGIATGVIGAVLGVAVVAYSMFEESQRAATQTANDFAQAIREDNGALGENTRALAAKKEQDSGLLATAQQYGISVGLVTSAVLGQTGAMDKLNAAIAQHVATTPKDMQQSGTTGQMYNKVAADADNFRSSVEKLSQSVGAGASQAKMLNDAMAATPATLSPAQTAEEQLAAKVGITSTALAAATTAQQSQAQAAQNTAAQMYLENDAAGILKTSLDALNGKTLTAADAQNAFDSSLVNMGTHVNETGKKITFTTSSINNMSSASVALRGQLNAQVQNLQNVVEANGGLSDSTGKARKQMESMRQQIINNAVAHGVDREAVTQYIDKLLKIPKSVPPTKLDVDTADALRKVRELQAWINGMHGTTVQINTIQRTVAYTVSGGNNVASKGGAPVFHAMGGLISGPGSGTSDSIYGVNGAGVPTVRVSNGEFLTNATSTAKYRKVLEAINAGTYQPGGGGPMELSDASINKLAAVMLQGISKGVSPIMSGLNSVALASRQGVAL